MSEETDSDHGLREPSYCPIMDEEDAVRQEFREASIETMGFFKRGYRVLLQYKGNAQLAQHAMALAFGWADLVECETAVDVAVKLFKNPKKKAAVTKAVKLFQDALGLEPNANQRSQDGRVSMTEARKKQLKVK